MKTTIAALLRSNTGVPTRVFDYEDLPWEWADYPQGYSIFNASLSIHTKRPDIAVYYKGEDANTALGAARSMLTKAGLECRSLRKVSVKRQPSIVVTAKRVS